MLTIKNIDKIVGERIVNEWYIKTIQPYTTMHNGNKNPSNQYKIVIQNKTTNSEGKIYLDREYKNKEIKHWYELICERECGKRRAQLITKKNIKDIKQLIYFIKVVVIDI